MAYFPFDELVEALVLALSHSAREEETETGVKTGATTDLKEKTNRMTY